jgi:hypothetical protein
MDNNITVELSDEQLEMVSGGDQQINSNSSANLANSFENNTVAGSALAFSNVGGNIISQGNANSQNNIIKNTHIGGFF